MANISIKRVYEAIAADDGLRILVDRLWPRGLKKEKAGVDLWLKNIAPSHELRKWFRHEAQKFPEFQQRYLLELREDDVKSQLVDELCELAQTRKVTLLYGAKDTVHNHAVVLQKEILHRIQSCNE